MRRRGSSIDVILREMVARAGAGEHLSAEQAAAAMEEMMSGEASPALIAGMLTALKMKGETAEEITGFARVMRERAVRVRPRCERLVDTCGTGGGSVPTFNVSTTAAFVAAGAGVSVAKHGNRAMTSACGSADVLEALGVRIGLSAEQVCACIEEIGIGFMFAQAHHPAMKHVAPVRRELPFRTLFNCIGPLTNPAGASSQVVGVYEPRLVPLLAAALLSLGCTRALVVHGTDGLDELSTLGISTIAEVRGGAIHQSQVEPDDVGLPEAVPGQIAPGRDPQENAAIVRAILRGEPGPRRDIVLLNAAGALLATGEVQDLSEGVCRAAVSIDSGAAQEKLEALAALTNS